MFMYYNVPAQSVRWLQPDNIAVYGVFSMEIGGEGVGIHILTSFLVLVWVLL
jgi:hypothetical protein